MQGILFSPVKTRNRKEGGIMGRPLRLKASGLTYHVTSRTHGKRYLLQNRGDKKALCKILKQITAKYQVVIYSFTVMNNHFHLFIRIDNEADLSQVLCEFKATFAKYYNKQYKISGSFWGDRFRSTIVQDDRHALTCLRYIDRNPVKAGLVQHPSKWIYTSFNSYAYGKNHPILPLTPHPSYIALAATKEKRRNLYLQLVIEPDEEADQLHGRLYRILFYGSEEFIQEIERKLN
jgi:putative transposase